MEPPEGLCRWVEPPSGISAWAPLQTGAWSAKIRGRLLEVPPPFFGRFPLFEPHRFPQGSPSGETPAGLPERVAQRRGSWMFTVGSLFPLGVARDPEVPSGCRTVRACGVGRHGQRVAAPLSLQMLSPSLWSGVLRPPQLGSGISTNGSCLWIGASRSCEGDSS